MLAEVRGVHLTGWAHIVGDPGLVGRARKALGEKYVGLAGDRAAMPEATRGHYETEHLLIEIVPDERILSDDNARIKVAP